MRTGEVEPDIKKLASSEKLAYVDELVAMKLAGRFAGEIPDDRFPFFEAEVDRLRAKLESEYAASRLRDGVSLETKEALDDLLVRARMKTLV